jgi:hypothetical protein
MVAFGLCAAIVILTAWFPGVFPALAAHRRLLEGTLFSASFTAIWVYIRWDLRRWVVFWTSILAFMVMHSAAVLSYSLLVHPILVWQWMIVLLVEAYLYSFFLEWTLHRFHDRR